MRTQPSSMVYPVAIQALLSTITRGFLSPAGITSVAHDSNYGSVPFRYGSAPLQTQLVKYMFSNHAADETMTDTSKSDLMLM